MWCKGKLFFADRQILAHIFAKNRGHTDFQSDALPTELRHHVFGRNPFVCGCKGTKKK